MTSEWIAVKERMPVITEEWEDYGQKFRCSDYVLVAHGGGNVTIAESYGNGNWGAEEGQNVPNVTHWQPLPAPPKGEENK